MKKVTIVLTITSCEGCSHYSNGAGFCEPSCGHPKKYENGEWVSRVHVPDSCPARLHPVSGYGCNCPERDSTYICDYCIEEMR